MNVLSLKGHRVSEVYCIFYKYFIPAGIEQMVIGEAITEKNI